MALLARPFPALDLADQHQNQKHDEHGAKQAARTITPAAAIAPVRKRAHQEQDQDDQQNCSKHEYHPLSLFKKTAELSKCSLWLGGGVIPESVKTSLTHNLSGST